MKFLIRGADKSGMVANINICSFIELRRSIPLL